MGFATTHAGQWGFGLHRPGWKVSFRGLHGTGVVMAVLYLIPLGNQAASHCT